MDIVFIKGLKVNATIGIFDWEQEILQPLHIDLDMCWDNSKAAQTGCIQDALDYAAVSSFVVTLIESRSWGLIEEVAEHIAAGLLNEFHVAGAKVKVDKPTAVPAANSVGVTIERGEF